MNNETQNGDIEQPGLGELISLREAAELSGLLAGCPALYSIVQHRQLRHRAATTLTRVPV